MTDLDLGTSDLDHKPLLLLALDHRASLARDVYGTQDPGPELTDRIRRDKQTIFQGLLAVHQHHHARARLGVLVDEQYGTEVAHHAQAAGIPLGMPVEASGHTWFTPEYGATLATGHWLEHVEALGPQIVKVLVRDNPDDDPAARRTQREQLATISSELDRDRCRFLIELLVPATSDQLAAASGDPHRYDTELRPRLTEQIIDQYHHSGVDPDLWKIEGLDTPQAAHHVSAAARAHTPAARCLVLGRDAPQHRLDHWLTTDADIEGFVGFAIGRSIWEQPLRDHLAGHVGGTILSQQVATNLTHYLETYLRARTQHPNRDTPEPDLQTLTHRSNGLYRRHRPAQGPPTWATRSTRSPTCYRWALPTHWPVGSAPPRASYTTAAPGPRPRLGLPTHPNPRRPRHIHRRPVHVAMAGMTRRGSPVAGAALRAGDHLTKDRDVPGHHPQAALGSFCEAEYR